MGLPNLHETSEGVVISLLLVTAALSLVIFKDILKSILHIIGVWLDPTSGCWDSDDCISSGLITIDQFPPFTEDVRYGIQVIQFKSIRCAQDIECTVCLTRFEHESYLSWLSCGHFFHKTCFQKWLDYWHSTCPLCRTSLVPGEEEWL